MTQSHDRSESLVVLLVTFLLMPASCCGAWITAWPGWITAGGITVGDTTATEPALFDAKPPEVCRPYVVDGSEGGS